MFEGAVVFIREGVVDAADKHLPKEVIAKQSKGGAQSLRQMLLGAGGRGVVIPNTVDGGGGNYIKLTSEHSTSVLQAVVNKINYFEHKIPAIKYSPGIPSVAVVCTK